MEIQVQLISADPGVFEISDELENLSLPTSTTKDQLNKLVNCQLIDPDADKLPSSFAFLVNGQLFQSQTIAQHILLHQIQTETQVQIHFFVDVSAPEPDMEYPHDDWVSDLEIGSTHLLSSTYNGTVTLWSRDDDNYGSDAEVAGVEANGENRMTRDNIDLSFAAHSSAVKKVKWIDQLDSNGKQGFITTSMDQTAILWRIDGRKNKKADKSSIRAKPMYKLKGHLESIDAVDVRLGKIVTGGYDHMLKVWDASYEEVVENDDDGQPEKKGPGQKGKPRTPLMTISGHSEAVTDIRFDRNDRVISSSMDHTVREWDIEIAKECSKIASAKAILAICTSENCIATGSTDRFVRLYDKKNRQQVASTLQFHTGWVSSVAFNPNNSNQLISGSFDKLAVLWDIRSNKTPLYQMDAHRDRITCVDWSADTIATGSTDSMVVTYNALSKLKSK